MPGEPTEQTGPIAVYGATGYTERLPEGPSVEARRRARFEIVCEARAGSRRRRSLVSGSDMYALTAETTVEAALRCAAPGYAVAPLPPS